MTETREVLFRRAVKLLKAVTIDEMGGEPDLFHPEPSWDAWNDEATETIKAIEALENGQK